MHHFKTLISYHEMNGVWTKTLRIYTQRVSKTNACTGKLSTQTMSTHRWQLAVMPTRSILYRGQSNWQRQPCIRTSLKILAIDGVNFPRGKTNDNDIELVSTTPKQRQWNSFPALLFAFCFETHKVTMNLISHLVLMWRTSYGAWSCISLCKLYQRCGCCL